MSQARIDRQVATETAAAILRAVGVDDDAAVRVADALVDADARGLPSHGLMLLPMYVDRVRAGSVSTRPVADVVIDRGAIGVLDAAHGLGQLSADQAMTLATDKAAAHGVGLVTVRRAFHLGGAYRYAASAARSGFVGVVAANTRPLMPAPGGARPVVGNNPIAIAVPRRTEEPLVLDMAMSEAALGKIRLAAQEGRAIPPTWATDADGTPTTDPEAAITGMLLPTGGPKGFGLALMVDVLTGILSGGGFGADVQGMYADVRVPNDSSQTFLAIDVAAFDDPDAFAGRVDALAKQIEESETAPGVDRVRLPGAASAARARDAAAHGVPFEPSVVDAIRRVADEVGATVPGSWR